MENNEITIRIINEVELNDALSKSGDKKLSSSNNGGEDSSINWKKKGFQLARKYAAALGNEQINEISGVVTTGVRYAGMISKGPVGVALVALDLGAQALAKAMENAKKIAAINNESDVARIMAGTLDVSNADISTNYFTGRYIYNSK